MTDDNSPKLWQPQPDEPPVWYNRFHIYLKLGPSRTLPTAYRIWAGSQGRPSRTTRKQSTNWNWKERAMAYDRANRKELAALETPRTAEARTRRLRGMVRIINNTADALDTADLKNLSTEKAHELLPSICLLFASTAKLQRHELQSHHPPEQSPRPPAGRNGTVRQKKSSDRITPMERYLTIHKLAGLERAAQALGCTPLQLSNFVSEGYVPQPGYKAVPTACQNEMLRLSSPIHQPSKQRDWMSQPGILWPEPIELDAKNAIKIGPRGTAGGNGPLIHTGG